MEKVHNFENYNCSTALAFTRIYHYVLSHHQVTCAVCKKEKSRSTATAMKNIVLSDLLPICELEYPRNPYEQFEQNKRREEKPLSLTYDSEEEPLSLTYDSEEEPLSLTYDSNNQTLENDAIIDVELEVQTLDAILEFERSERTKDLSSVVIKFPRYFDDYVHESSSPKSLSLFRPIFFYHNGDNLIDIQFVYNENELSLVQLSDGTEFSNLVNQDLFVILNQAFMAYLLEDDEDLT